MERPWPPSHTSSELCLLERKSTSTLSTPTSVEYFCRRLVHVQVKPTLNPGQMFQPNTFQRHNCGPHSLLGDFSRGKIKSKRRRKYPKLSRVLLPFQVPRKTDKTHKEETKPIFDEALEILVQRRRTFNPEIIESALRIAIANREELRMYGFINRAKKYSRNILYKKENQTETEKFLEQLRRVEKVEDKKAMWNRARFLALVRSKRGTRNWAKARKRISRVTGKTPKKSFWRKATEMVFPVSKDQKLIKVL